MTAPLGTQSSSVGGGSRPGVELRCRAAYAVIRELPDVDGDDGGGGGGGEEEEDEARVMTACPGSARRSVYQVRGSGVEISVVGSKTVISSSALLLRFDGR